MRRDAETNKRKKLLVLGVIVCKNEVLDCTLGKVIPLDAVGFKGKGTYFWSGTWETSLIWGHTE